MDQFSKLLISFFFVIIIFKYIFPLIFKRSFMSVICEIYLRVTNKHHDYTKTKDDLIHKLSKKEPKYNLNPIISRFYHIKQQVFDKTDIYTFCGKKNGCILYLHGGGYVNQPLIFHWHFLSKISHITDFSIVVPIYPKAPFHHYEESYEIITKLYLNLRSRYKTVILMGDSSGGGLALGLCESFICEKIEQPNELVLIAPWTDLTLSNPKIEEVKKFDPRNNASQGKALGESWANGDVLNYKVSPIFGCLKGLKNVTTFVGTYDILYPDAVKLSKMLSEEGVKNRLIVENKMNHVYPVYPIPEAKKSINEICSIILSANSD